VYQGSLPPWTVDAGVPPSRYVVSHEGNLVGVLFGGTLRSPSPAQGPSNKILWISAEPRAGADLKVTLTPSGGGGPVTEQFPANSSPGEIYPSIVDVPKPGCWNVVAEWNGNRATLELPYEKG